MMGNEQKIINSSMDTLFNAISNSTDDYIYMCDFNAGLSHLSDNMVKDFDLPSIYMADFDKFWIDKIHPDEKGLFLSNFNNMMEGKSDFHNVEYRARNSKDEWVWLRCRGQLVRDEKGCPLLFAGIICNLQQKSTVDNITGLLNKGEFKKTINSQINKNSKFSVMVLDFDDFKNINSLYNREFGDEILRVTAQGIQNLLLSYMGSIYRLDGDELGIVLHTNDSDTIKKVYDEISFYFSRHQEYEGKKFHGTLSAGCSIFPDHSSNLESLIKDAHEALFCAKSSGKNKIIFFKPELIKFKTREVELTELLHESIENNFENFSLFCQPQVVANNSKLHGGEALLRWRCEKYGNISPFEFIPILEKSSMIIPVGRWVFKNAVHLCKKWADIYPNFTMSVNVSYVQLLYDRDLVKFMENTVREAGINFSNIIVELTESHFVSDKEFLKSIFSSIRKLGMKIAMDDFGTGYSSLGLFKEVPADIVKIDKTFVKNIKNVDNQFDTTFIRFTVEMCHSVGILVCLEGVEELEEYNIVSSMHLDLIQGYLFGKPEDEDTFYNNHLKAFA